MVSLQRGCRDTALNYLTRREHSRVELHHKLSAKGFDKAEIEYLLDELEAAHLLSDERFTESYIRSRQQRGFGPLRIKMELKQRGVAEDIIKRCLDVESVEWLKLAREQHRKRFGNEAVPKHKNRMRQARFLQNRGFSSETIFTILDHIGVE